MKGCIKIFLLSFLLIGCVQVLLGERILNTELFATSTFPAAGGLYQMSPTSHAADYSLFNWALGNSTITGTVTGPDGVTPLESVGVSARRWDGRFWGYQSLSRTGKDGKYDLDFLPEGLYRIEFEGRFHLLEYYKNTTDFESSQVIVLGDKSTVSGINASLLEKAKITGRLTASDGVTSLEYAYAQAYKKDAFGNWNYAAEARTHIDGTYVLEGLNAGIYRVGFLNDPYPKFETPIITPEYYNGVSTIISADDITVSTGMVVNGINASLIEKGKITGKVTGPDGVSPIPQILVFVERKINGSWSPLTFTLTRADGTYTLRGVEADNSSETSNFRVSFADNTNGVFETEYYDSKYDRKDAVDIYVKANTTVENVNASLLERGKITGNVTDERSGIPLNGIVVKVYSNKYNTNVWLEELFIKALTGADGSYELRGLPTGNYRIKFSDPDYRRDVNGFKDSNEIKYSDEYYGSVTSVSSATDVSVRVGETVVEVNGSLVEAGKITGLVTNLNGSFPLENITVVAHRLSDTGNFEYMKSVLTQSDGRYTIRQLEEGNYRLIFFDFKNNMFIAKAYDNSEDIRSAKNIFVKTNTPVTGINISLQDKGKISGKVTGPGGVILPQGVIVSSFRKMSGEWQTTAQTTTLADGSYILKGLEAGSYRLKFEDYNEFYDMEFYNDCKDIKSAVDIVVNVNSAVTNINVEMNRFRPKMEVYSDNKLLKSKMIINFGRNRKGKKIFTKYFTIKNSGMADLNWIDLKKSGVGSPNFTFSKINNKTLIPNESVTFKVTYNPKSSKKSVVSLLISSGDDTNPYFIIQLSSDRKNGRANNEIVPFYLTNFGRSTAKSVAIEERMVATPSGKLNYQTLTILKSSLHESTVATVEVSSNLIDWYSGDDHTTILSSHTNYLRVRDKTPFSKENKRFIRLKKCK